MLSQPDDRISQLSLLFRAIVFTLLMVLMSGKLETRKFPPVSEIRPLPYSKSVKLAIVGWKPNLCKSVKDVYRFPK